MITRTTQIRRLARIVNGGTPTPAPENWEGDVAWATPVDVGRNHGGVVKSTERTITQEGLRAGSSQVPGNSVVLSTRAPVGYVALTDEALAFNQGCKGLVPLPGVDPRYLAYTLIYSAPEMEARSTGTTFLELSTAGLAGLPVPTWDHPTQVRIADFLDRETSQIDALVQEQRALVDLLWERRSAAIKSAITKGVVADAPLIESGEQWIGTLPAHWGVAQVRRIGVLLTGTTPVGDEAVIFSDDPDDTPWVRPEDLGSRDAAGRGLTDEGLRQLRTVPAGAVLVCGIGATVSKTGQSSKRVATNQQITAWIHDLDPGYAYFVMTAAKDGVLAATVGNTLPILNNMRLGGVRIPVPPRPEQVAISEHIERTTSQIDSMIDSTKESIALMLERRSALIAAAVTGRIDPRTGQETKEAS